MEKLVVNIQVRRTPFAGLECAQSAAHTDNRGTFFRAFCESELERVLGGRHVRQINLSQTSTPGAIRGLHFQRPPAAELKLVRCLKGRVWDVAVDLRPSSPTYLKWHSQELSEQNRCMLVIPEGFAHGFQVLEPDSQILYLHTALYQPELEGGVRYDDPALSIQWPLNVSDVSARDRSHPLIDKHFQGIIL